MSLPPQKLAFPSLSGTDAHSFAYTTLKDRIPVIVTKCIDDVTRTISLGEEGCKALGQFQGISEWESVVRQGQNVINQLARLKYEISHNGCVYSVLPDSTEQDDSAAWNWLIDEHWGLDAFGSGKWFGVSWLFAEVCINQSDECFFF